MKTATIALVALVAIVGLIFISSPSNKGLIIIEKVVSAYDPNDYRLGNDCYIGFKQTEKIVPAKNIRIQNKHAGETYNHWVDERFYHLCGKAREDTPSHTFYVLCPQMANCRATVDKFDRPTFKCVQRSVEKVTYCD